MVKIEKIMMHRPSVEIEYAMLVLKPFLFERVFNIQKAREKHIKLEELLKENGITVYRLENEIISKSENSETFRKMIINYLLKKVHFYGKIDESTDAERNFKKNIEFLDSKTLFD